VDLAAAGFRGVVGDPFAVGRDAAIGVVVGSVGKERIRLAVAEERQNPDAL
jgi:hypothetical protein